MKDPRDEPPQYGERVPAADPVASPYDPYPHNEPPQRLTAPPRPPAAQLLSGAWVTYLLIALCVVVFIAQYSTGLGSGPVTQATVFYAPYALSQPWRFVTALFAHASLLHIASNMFSLFIMGPQLERLVGHWRFAVLYFLSGFGGGVAVQLLLPTTPTLGASGAIFGLLGAYFVIARRLGGSVTQILVVIAINLAIGFYVPNIAWQAHIGGLIVGGLVALVFARARTDRNRGSNAGLLALIAVALVVTATVTSIVT